MYLAEKNNEENYDVLDIYSTSDLFLKDSNNNEYNSRGIIEKISSIKNSINYENKKLKINTFRFSIYNYYDR